MVKKNKNVVYYFDLENVSRSELLDSIKNYFVDYARNNEFVDKKLIDNARFEYQLTEEEVQELIQFLSEKNIGIATTFELQDLIDILEEGLKTSEEDINEENELIETIKCSLGLLTELEKKVVSLRYALEGGRPKTLEEVGKELNLTREKVRSIEYRAIRKVIRFHSLESKYTA